MGVGTTDEIRSGRPLGVAQGRAPSGAAALLDYVRSLGCRDMEIVQLGNATVSARCSATAVAVPSGSAE